jgi:hypothetical protein
MDLFTQIVTAYPELTYDNFGALGAILLRDDSDGKGPYIARWDYAKPIPTGLKLGK